ncbi:MAG TPA: type II toxin-antitoxin system HicB family antitoxin [Syntrophomonadaceae bacterium]|nr:type II toxin-antitoxin system HicB family antitoxin [Syntrophomonadaceae bacterium]
MAKYIFPAVFDPGNDGTPGYTVTFPDLPGCITEGSDINEAMAMAKDALAGFLYGMEEDGEAIPIPSDPSKINLPPGAFIALVEAWTDIVKDEMENKTVKKTLTIPKWLNDAAEKQGINFSHVLQFALKQQLGIRSRK